MRGIRYLEGKYGIKVIDDSFYNPFIKKWRKLYKIYTADGCLWENGLTYRGTPARDQSISKYILTN